MNKQPKLSEAEWELVIDLLQEEHDELPAEIHHCDVTSYREELQHRHAMVKNLLERLHVT